MAKYSASNKPLTAAALRNKIATDTGLTRKQVAAILDALASQIKNSLDTAGSITILGRVKIEKKTILACPTWPASVKISVVPELLPGPDYDCSRGLHSYYRSPAENDHGQPVCGVCGRDTISQQHEADRVPRPDGCHVHSPHHLRPLHGLLSILLRSGEGKGAGKKGHAQHRYGNEAAAGTGPDSTCGSDRW